MKFYRRFNLAAMRRCSLALLCSFEAQRPRMRRSVLGCSGSGVTTPHLHRNGEVPQGSDGNHVE